VDVGAREAGAVLLSGVLADFPRSERRMILANARGVLSATGLILISETLLDDDGSGPPRAALISLVLLAAMRGDQLCARELREDLAESGFDDVAVHRIAPRDLVVARRRA
jgi:hypothetical protein